MITVIHRIPKENDMTKVKQGFNIKKNRNLLLFSSLILSALTLSGCDKISAGGLNLNNKTATPIEKTTEQRFVTWLNENPRAFKCSRNVINEKIVEERLGKDNFARKQTEFVNQTIKNVRVKSFNPDNGELTFVNGQSQDIAYCEMRFSVSMLQKLLGQQAFRSMLETFNKEAKKTQELMQMISEKEEIDFFWPSGKQLGLSFGRTLAPYEPDEYFRYTTRPNFLYIKKDEPLINYFGTSNTKISLALNDKNELLLTADGKSEVVHKIAMPLSLVYENLFNKSSDKNK